MSSIRYGIFLRPDPLTCWAQIQVNLALTQQFGLVSAAAFPPHATLVGNLRTDASIAELEERLGAALFGIATFPVVNAGVRRVGPAYLYNIHEDEYGQPNLPFMALAAAVKAAMLPISIPVADFLVTPVEQSSFEGHLSLASHDLLIDDSLADEVGTFLAELPISPPPSFEARVVSLLEFTSDDWNGQWWRTLRWRVLRSWELVDA